VNEVKGSESVPSMFPPQKMPHGWHAQRVDCDQLVELQDLSGKSLIELAKICFHKKFQLKRTNGFRVMAFQNFGSK
jgi:hypothetical protein